MKRRAFIAGLGGIAAWPLVARAQQPAMPTIGFLSPTSPDGSVSRLRAIQLGLSETGYFEGQNVAFEYRWADDKYERLPALAADLARGQSAVMVSIGGSAGAVAAKSATKTIPIVFVIGADPVKLGLVTSLNRPGGNVTGVTVVTVETLRKRLEILQTLTPKAEGFAVLINPSNPNIEAYSRDVQEATRALGRQIDIYKIGSESDYEKAFAALSQRRTGGVVVSADPVFVARPDKLVSVVTRYSIPAVYPYREFVTAGGLMSYGPKLSDAMRQAGSYTGRILKGAKPGDLPVQEFTDTELVINLKVAKGLGLTVPILLLSRATEVIE